MNVALSEKDRKFREFALEGSMWSDLASMLSTCNLSEPEPAFLKYWTR